MNKNYRWGILGAGRIAEKFCTALTFTEGAEVYAIASHNIDRAKNYAIKFNVVKFYNSYEELAKDDNVDIIYIATPHAFHYEQTIMCLNNGKAVLCEKPMSLNYKQTDEMFRLATEKKLFLMEGMWTRFMPFLEKILLLIKEDVIGKLQYVYADFGFAAPEDFNGRLYNKRLGGGSVLDIGVYCIFLATLLLGEPEGIKILSELTETGVDSYANMIMQYAGGAASQLLSSITFNTRLEAEIIGSKGKIMIECPWYKATEFSVQLQGGETEKFVLPHESNGFEYEIREVMECLDKNMLQSNKMPHLLSLSISRIMDIVLMEAGVKY